MAIDAGIDMMEAVTSDEAGTPRLMYPISTDPEMVENPEVMARWSSEGVIRSTKG